MKNKEGYSDPTADQAIYDLHHTYGRLDYTKFDSYEDLIEYIIQEKGLKTKAGARAYIQDHMPKESYFQKRIIQWIKKHVKNCMVWKEAAGPYSRQGIPDITCIVNGRYYGFEVKRPFIGKLSQIQEQTIKDIRDAGGRAYVVSSEIDVAFCLLPEMAENLRKAKGRVNGSR